MEEKWISIAEWSDYLISTCLKLVFATHSGLIVLASDQSAQTGHS